MARFVFHKWVSFSYCGLLRAFPWTKDFSIDRYCPLPFNSNWILKHSLIFDYLPDKLINSSRKNKREANCVAWALNCRQWFSLPLRFYHISKFYDNSPNQRVIYECRAVMEKNWPKKSVLLWSISSSLTITCHTICKQYRREIRCQNPKVSAEFTVSIKVANFPWYLKNLAYSKHPNRTTNETPIYFLAVTPQARNKN